jgi:periplasmic protein TonB
VGMHVLLGWALVSGLQHKVVDVIKGPVETQIIEELKPPPPELPAPPLEFAAPPLPSFVPPPEVHVVPPTTPAPTISAITTVPPPAPAITAPVLAAAPVAPPAQAALLTVPAPIAPVPTSRTAPSLDFNGCEKPTYDAATMRAGVTGTVVVGYAMDTHGNISEARIERSAGASREHKILDRLTIAAVTRCRGRPGTVDGKSETLRGSVEYAWRLD